MPSMTFRFERLILFLTFLENFHSIHILFILRARPLDKIFSRDSNGRKQPDFPRSIQPVQVSHSTSTATSGTTPITAKSSSPLTTPSD